MSQDTSSESLPERLRQALLTLAEARGVEKTFCPSEAARRVAPDDWRAQMPATRDAARILAQRGQLIVSQRGRTLPSDGPWHGPIRLRLPVASESSGRQGVTGTSDPDDA
ncbi:DUF3253 domain-containing protein [Salinicola halophilus]|uniref:DUF3253 domain-containing protein n=1 Tax=Salinicola halophilus TaxID=184065 RepID=UPI0019550DCC|nr:DUF3253 domain-containing protein [Salinicola halophilus]